jgi:hypothetical protein
MLAAFDRADRDRINHQPRFEACLDRKQPTNLSEHQRASLESLIT